MVVQRTTGELKHRKFKDLAEYVGPGDVLVLNDSRVIPARLRAQNTTTGGRFEILLLEESGRNEWWTMMRPGKRARSGTRLTLSEPDGKRGKVEAIVLALNEEGHRLLRFEGTPNILRDLEHLGEVPLPPYISRAVGPSAAFDRERYQTVFAKPEGSVAAPTAGLHFTETFLEELRARGVEICFVTLHVGPGTFNPVKVKTIAEHKMHTEKFSLPAKTAEVINKAKARGRRILAIGTTSLRVLESVARKPPIDPAQTLTAETSRTDIFIYPPSRFRIVDALLTNFHLPRSSLLMLASAFAAPGETGGRDLILHAYGEAIRESYRFFSYGDAMLIL
jgi:S-adenosylmethionine:tRNA ribosyltransferase-isomerase